MNKNKTSNRRFYLHGKWSTKGPMLRTSSRVDDQVAVQRLSSGDISCISAGRATRIAALDLVDRHGLSARQVAERLGCSCRTVVRRRTERRQENKS